MRKLALILSLILFIGLETMTAQTKDITGKVVDDLGEAIPGVSIVVKGTTIGTVSRPDGTYALSVPSDATNLIFTFVGLESQDVLMAGQSTINVTMQPDTEDLDEVVVTGYGVTTKAAFTGAATTLDDDKIANRTNVNVMRALEGNIAGLQMNTGSGQPGAPSEVYIRGKNSLNSGTQPLYVIDGIPMESGTLGMREDEGVEYSPLSSINANDIESMTVLKDATATSIYGARAANGVVVITTKRGKTGSKTKVNFSMKMGWEELPSYTDDYRTVNADEYNELQVEGWNRNICELFRLIC